MPNIEIYGHTENYGYGMMAEIRSLINEYLSELSKDIIYTIIESAAKSHQAGQFCPYIRVCDVDIKRAEKICKLINKRFSIRVELLKLQGFYSGQ